MRPFGAKMESGKWRRGRSKQAENHAVIIPCRLYLHAVIRRKKQNLFFLFLQEKCPAECLDGKNRTFEGGK